MGDKNKPADIAKAAVNHAKKNDFNVVIIDTAGRLHIDEEMMAELMRSKKLLMFSDHPRGRCDDRSGCGKCSRYL